MFPNTESFKISYFSINDPTHQNQAKSSEDSTFEWHASKKNKTMNAKKLNQSNLNIKMHPRNKIKALNTRKVDMLKKNNHEAKTGNRCFSLNLKCLRLDLDYANEAKQS
ncbi:hypothetical protein SteCoe_14761 [Stentor coeruleus]|uniref:Uncharacterized protein n=1 Tax=Stentor coeruleus TaxID=5963 RepID=A0A1R2C5C4_9CILI|nr:hypothetical protein SteCoe_14761 [Stentor coeruleus]